MCKKLSIILSIIFLMNNCSNKQDETFRIDYEKYQLDNGLNVILHEDHSDPLVALATIVHVGSNREKPGRTGFAHFFEHMSFNDSENVPRGANRKMVSELGGTRNGGTWSDGTMYYEVVPKDALEKLMWIDSDRLGYMINTVTEDALEREKQVVKNEKRERVDNQAYGHTDAIIRKALYPKEHPYNWTVIGELEDLQAATIDDVKEFYNKFYGPNNATLVVAGDINIEETKALIKKWFGEIKSTNNVEDPEVQLVTLNETSKLYYLDKFARLPEIRITFPTVQEFHEDSYALSTLGRLLADGKNSPLYKEIVEQQRLAPNTSASQSSYEIAGKFTIRIRGNSGVSLDTLYSAIMNGLDNFNINGVNETDLKRIKAKQETGFYNNISSALDKAFQLGIYNEFAGDPGFISKDVENIKKVTKEDVLRVFNKYIKNKNAIITSVVPESEPELILTGSKEAYIKEEEIVQDAEKKFDADANIEYEKTASVHDRSEPPLGDLPLLKVPDVWQSQLSNGMKIYGIEHSELPLVQFSLRIDGGQVLDPIDKIGTSVMLASILNEGTENKTPAELEEAIGLLGARINISSDLEALYVSGNTLSRNLEQTMSLVTEMLTQPRWDSEAYDIVKNRRLTSIKQSKTRPQLVSINALRKQLYGKSHPRSFPVGGTIESVNQITMKDLKDHFYKYISPKDAHIHIVGDINKENAKQALNKLESSWNGESVKIPKVSNVEIPSEPRLYFIDIPSAKQSAITIGKPIVKGSDLDHYKIQVVNNRLGAGSSARLFQTLRIEKGYTYGAYSNISENQFQSTFLAYGQVRSNVTLESLEIFRELIRDYSKTFEESDLEKTKNLLIKQNTRRFETLSNLLDMLDSMTRFQLKESYIEEQQETLVKMNLDEIRDLANQYLNENNMIYVIAGDSKTQLSQVKEFGYGEPILLDRDGNKVSNYE